MGDFKRHLSGRAKSAAKIEDINDKINQLDLVDKYRSFYSTENEYFLRAHMEH